jgi:hypothetical protein
VGGRCMSFLAIRDRVPASIRERVLAGEAAIWTRSYLSRMAS